MAQRHAADDQLEVFGGRWGKTADGNGGGGARLARSQNQGGLQGNSKGPRRTPHVRSKKKIVAGNKKILGMHKKGARSGWR